MSAEDTYPAVGHVAPPRSLASVDDFFDHFARALGDGDAKAIAAMWETPGVLIGDQQVIAVNAPEEVEKLFSGAKEQYNKRGLMEARAEIVRLDWPTDRIATVEVRWPYIDQKGVEIGEESSTYTLRRDDADNLKLRAVVMHGAKEKAS
jgi:hypothetical protein